MTSSNWRNIEWYTEIGTEDLDSIASIDAITSTSEHAT